MDGLSLPEEVIFFIFEMVTGDSRLSDLIFQRPSKTADERRSEFLMPLLAVVMSVLIVCFQTILNKVLIFLG